MSKVDKIYNICSSFYVKANIFKAYEGALNISPDLKSDRSNPLIESDNINKKEPTQKFYSDSKTYQSPLKVGKMGIEGEDPWVISGFIGKHVNISPRHPQGHEGVDFGAPMNAPVYPIAPGKVTQTSNTPKGGLNLTIYHEEDNLYSYYAHLNKINVSTGEIVGSNTIIGLNGNTGSAKGTHPHVHLECKINNKKIDPRSIINKEIGSLK